MFKVGDKIKIIDDDQTGTVIKVSKQGVSILNEHGFEETFSASELILNQELLINDFNPKPETKPIKSKPHQSDAPKEIDLHIGHLVDYPSGLSNYEMLQIQLNKVKYEIDSARTDKRNRIIFIHGHGSGKLREELYKLLEAQSRLEYYDASFQKYKLGATEVRLF
ncbi:Smr/MutS family protein [Moheibacter sediminis]|uniref:Smr/MutS family protein n=1 Tax=Moheibacter sediminis TaxID=1434700 RepID=UPI00373FC9D4